MMNSKALTYDYHSAFSEEMQWKCGVYDISMKLPLDYSLHLREKSFRTGSISIRPEDLVYVELDPPSYDEEPKIVFEFMQSIMNAAKQTASSLYNFYVIGSRRAKEKIPDLIKFECGPFVYVVFNAHGIWPAVFKNSIVDEKNYLTYNQKDSDVFVWDNYKPMRADY